MVFVSSKAPENVNYLTFEKIRINEGGGMYLDGFYTPVSGVYW